MASTAISGDFVSIVAEEMASGIDRALRYWLGRIELEVVDRSLTTAALRRSRRLSRSTRV
jgi:hypothetical protein